MLVGMKIFRPFGDTNKGLLLIGISGGVSFALLSALMFAFRAQCEPLLRLILELLPRKRSFYQYNPEGYYIWAACAAGMSLIWIMLMVVAILNKPRVDRRIDKNLKSKINQSARGAPLEPR